MFRYGVVSKELINSRDRFNFIDINLHCCFCYRCHLAKNNYEGTQANGQVSQLAYHDWSPTIDTDKSPHGCIVLYQTPIVHLSKNTINMAGRFETVSKLLCRHFRLKKGVIGKGGLGFAYQLFNAPTI